LHQSNVENVLIVHKLLQPFLAKMGVATQEELEYLHDQVEKEFQAEDFCLAISKEVFHILLAGMIGIGLGVVNGHIALTFEVSFFPLDSL
jgi:hypothetical protein